jgi:hypothetical protein
VQSSVTNIFAPENGWPFDGELADSESVYEKEKKLKFKTPISLVDVKHEFSSR